MTEATRTRRRPRFGWLVAVAVLLRVGRDVVQRVVPSSWGIAGVVVLLLVAAIVVGGWRYALVRRARARGTEFTPAQIVAQVEQSGYQPAFEEDGTLLGASIVVVNQHPKVIEVSTHYEVFDRHGTHLADVRQIGQSRAKRLVRLLTGFDQYLTHTFEVVDASGEVTLRLLRPAKVFYSTLHVTDQYRRPLGSLHQENIFWKIRFEVRDASGAVVGRIRASNLRAWDFEIHDERGREVATLFKAWEGWTRAALTRADHYVLRIAEPLDSPLRELVLSAAFVADLALKQDTRR